MNVCVREIGKSRDTGVGGGGQCAEQGPSAQVARDRDHSGTVANSQVAERVFEAVRDERFYVLTHPTWKPAIRARMETILEERTPAFGVAPP